MGTSFYLDPSHAGMSYYRSGIKQRWLFRSHAQIKHQEMNKMQQRKLRRFNCPGMRKACQILINACLSCLQVKDPSKMKFPLKLLESSELNEVVQIDHQKICMTDTGYNQILVIIDYPPCDRVAPFVPCRTGSRFYSYLPLGTLSLFPCSDPSGEIASQFVVFRYPNQVP